MCSFCNQNKITGQAYQPTPLDVEQTLGKAAFDLGERTKNAEIAFFGGSFTAIDRTYMLSQDTGNAGFTFKQTACRCKQVTFNLNRGLELCY